MAPKAKPAETDSTLKREVAGRYVTRDGRFAVEQSSSGWLLIDNDATDELGQALVRGQFGTREAAREAIDDARTGPAPVSRLERRLAERPSAPSTSRATPARRGPAGAQPSARPRSARPRTDRAGEARETRARRGTGRATPTTSSSNVAQEPPPVAIREYRRSDGSALRALWREAEFRLRGDDDDSLATMARRNPGLMLVATEAKEIVGSALGAWDGRHGWIYHMATAKSHRRSGVGRSLVEEIERRLGALGCYDVNVNVGETNAGAQRFWSAVGYPAVATRRYRKELREG
jgi:ribosomal protein S18 acetylase RimI-like enzyme